MNIVDALVIGAFTFLCGITLGVGLATKSLKSALVKDGLGEYYIDKNNERQFRIKKPK